MENLCFICPRKCGVDRNKTLGFCKCNNNVKIAKVMLHHFEEPPISGDCESQNGSGAIFFSGCNLKCCYCQNSELSHKCFGKEIPLKLWLTFLNSLKLKVHIILIWWHQLILQNKLLKHLKFIKPKIPVVWNTSGYETAQTIKMLSGYVDIFLTDFKYFDDNLAKEFSLAPDYAKIALLQLSRCERMFLKMCLKMGLWKKALLLGILFCQIAQMTAKKF